MSLGKKVIRSGIWLQASKIMQLLSNIVFTIILARLLPPDIFGLAGIVFLYTAFIAQFTMVGITLGIIQKKEITQSQLSTAFWINASVGVISALIIAVSAPLAVKFYNQPRLLPLVLIISLNFLITPLYQIHRRLLEKEILFNKIAIIEIVAISGSGLIAILSAFLGFGVYSLIFQSLSLNVLYCVSTLLFKKWKPDFSFNFSEIKDIFIFSVKMKISRLGSYFGRNIDYIILSKLFTPTLYGLYTLAYRILYFPVRRFAYTFTEILFPAFSSIQEDRDKIKRGINKVNYLLSLALFPIFIILVFFSEELTLAFLGKKWIQIGSVLYIFFAAGMVQTFDAIYDSVYPALNKPGILIRLEIFRIAITAAAVTIGSFYKLFGVAVALLISRIVLFAINYVFVKKLINVSLMEFLKNISKPAILSILLSAFLFVAGHNPGIHLFGLIIYILIICLFFYGLLYIIDRVKIKYYFSLIFKSS